MKEKAIPRRFTTVNVINSKYINPLLPGVPFLYPLKTSENLCFFIFSADIKREHQAVMD